MENIKVLIDEYVSLFGLGAEEANQIKKSYRKFNKTQKNEALELMIKIVDDAKKEGVRKNLLDGKKIYEKSVDEILFLDNIKG